MAGLVLVLALPAASASAETLTVSKSPAGAAGIVTSSPPGINCGSDCTEDYPAEEFCTEIPGKPQVCHPVYQSVQLTAGGQNGFAIQGWTGCTSETAEKKCNVTMGADQTVTAHYADVQNPSVALTEPTSGAMGGSIDLKATAGDNSEVARVEFLVRNVTVATDPSAPYAASVDTTKVDDGVAAVNARAVDTVGRTTTSSATTITIDNTAPEVGVTGPDDETFGPGSTQIWTIDSHDATSGIAEVECSVVPEGSSASFTACSGGNGSHSVQNRPDGSYEFAVRATDAAGNFAETARRHFTIDATPPETTITSGPADGSSSTSTSATFGFSSSEPGATYLCRVYPAALTPPAFVACSGAAGHTASGFSPGTYAFEVVAIDPVGNTDPTPAKRVFTVLAPPPAGTGGPGARSGSADRGTTPVSSMSPKVSQRWVTRRGQTKVRKLLIRGLPSNALVSVRCRGKGCPFKAKRVKPRNGVAQLTGLFGKQRLKPRTTVEVRVTRPDGAGVLYRYVTRQGGKAPRAVTLCVEPGSSKPKRCT